MDAEGKFDQGAAEAATGVFEVYGRLSDSRDALRVSMLRECLAMLGYYELGDRGHCAPTVVDDDRAMIKEFIDQLDATDIEAVFYALQGLTQTPRDPAVLETAARMKKLGIGWLTA